MIFLIFSSTKESVAIYMYWHGCGKLENSVSIYFYLALVANLHRSTTGKLFLNSLLQRLIHLEKYINDVVTTRWLGWLGQTHNVLPCTQTHVTYFCHVFNHFNMGRLYYMLVAQDFTKEFSHATARVRARSIIVVLF